MCVSLEQVIQDQWSEIEELKRIRIFQSEMLESGRKSFSESQARNRKLRIELMKAELEIQRLEKVLEIVDGGIGD